MDDARVSSANLRTATWPRWFTVAGILYVALAASVAGTRARSSSDFRDFWENALHFRLTGEISSALGVHNYLPAFTILATPISLLPLEAAIAAFTAFSLLLLAYTARRLDLRLARIGRDWRAPLGLTPGTIGLLLTLPYIHTCAVLGALGVLLTALVVAAWLHVERGRARLAGALLGLGTLLKLLPGALVLLFAVQRRWTAVAGAIVLLLLGGVLLPVLTIGWAQTVAQHEAFYERAVAGHSGFATIQAEKPIKANYSNNATPMVLRRLLSAVNAGKDDTPDLFVNIANLPRPLIAGIYVVFMLVVSGISVVVALRGASEGDPLSGGVVFAAWCCLALLASPLMWTHYLTLAYLPVVLLVCNAVQGRTLTRRVSVAALAVWLVSIAMLAWPAARAAGAQWFAVLAVWCALAIHGFAARHSRISAASSG